MRSPTAATPTKTTAVAPSTTAATNVEAGDDESRAGSMILLLSDKKQVLPMPTPSPTYHRPRKQRAKTCNGITWVLALLAAASVMAAVAAAAMAMAARAEISRLRADVERLRTRLGSHEYLQNYIHEMLEPGMGPVQEEEDEDVVWEAAQKPKDLSPPYPEDEYEFPADVKGTTSSRHSRRHIPMVGGSYGSSDNGWSQRKRERRLKLYEALATEPPPPSPPSPLELKSSTGTSRETTYHHRSGSGRLDAVPVPIAPPDRAVVARRQDSNESNPF